jgi:hypothetical protein
VRTSGIEIEAAAMTARARRENSPGLRPADPLTTTIP